MSILGNIFVTQCPLCLSLITDLLHSNVDSMFVYTVDLPMMPFYSYILPMIMLTVNEHYTSL